MRPEAGPAAAAATLESDQPNSTGDEEAVEMTEEQMQAERRAALSAMPTFGGGLTGFAAPQQQSSVSGLESGQLGSLGAAMPKSSFSFGAPAASLAAGQSASAPQAGAASAWPSLIRTQPASTDASRPNSQQTSPASVFGRLAAGGASAIGHPATQQVHFLRPPLLNAVVHGP